MKVTRQLVRIAAVRRISRHLTVVHEDSGGPGDCPALWSTLRRPGSNAPPTSVMDPPHDTRPRHRHLRADRPPRGTSRRKTRAQRTTVPGTRQGTWQGTSPTGRTPRRQPGTARGGEAMSGADRRARTACPCPAAHDSLYTPVRVVEPDPAVAGELHSPAGTDPLGAAGTDRRVLAWVRLHGHPLGMVASHGTPGDPAGPYRASADAARRELPRPVRG